MDLVSGRYTVDAKSLLGIYSLNLGNPLQVVIHGENTQALAQQLKPFLAD